METTTITDSILAVFSAVAEWLSDALTAMMSLFYADGALTVLGNVCIISLAIGVAFLLIGVIQNFIKFRS